MYKKSDNSPQMGNLPYFLDGTLNPDNRWVKLAGTIPWIAVEELYSSNFKSKLGPRALPARVAFGSLIIQIKLGLTDEETVEALSENPYLQFFIGLEQYIHQAPFDASLMTHFRQRFNANDIKNIDELLYKICNTEKEEEKNSDDDPPANRGSLIVDATCVPSDIKYPTDIELLNKAREKTEKVIDLLWKHRINKDDKQKPRTNRQKARKRFMSVILKKKVSRKKRRECIGYQLNCIERNLQSIEKLKVYCSLSVLGEKLYKDLLVVGTLYSQQKHMYENKINSVEDRIVSIHQPHVRPIVRGKAGAHTEFGAKVSVSVVNGWTFTDTISFDAYNEGTELISQIQKYHQRFGYYPESVHADKIYRNATNRRFCKENKIRLSGPQLGRPTKDLHLRKQQKQIQKMDEAVRNTVEGKFGVGKRRYEMDRIVTKLKSSSELVIALLFMVMNVDRAIAFREFFIVLKRQLQAIYCYCLQSHSNTDLEYNLKMAPH